MWSRMGFRLAVVLFLLNLCAAIKQDEKRQIHHTSHPHTTQKTPDHSDSLKAWMSRTSSSKPNILFLIADDLRPELGCYGDTNMVTPNIDHLASKSVMFKNAYAQVALCAPSRTSFLTGRRADTTRVFDLETYFRKVGGNFTTLPQFFKRHGYFSQAVGKIFHPGMDSSGLNDKLYSWSAETFFGEDPMSATERHKAAIHPVNTSRMGKLQDKDIADFAVNFLRQRTHNHDQPFFLAVGFHKPHLPWVFPKEYLDLYPLSNIHLAEHRTRPKGMPDIAWSQSLEIRNFLDVGAVNTSGPDKIIPDYFQKRLRQAYSAATSYMDYELGRVLKALTHAGFADNTIVSFLGDHGWQLGENAEWCKHTNFETALRIPMMVYIPGVTGTSHNFNLFDALAPGFKLQPVHIGSSRSTEQLVEAVDLYPTLIELSGLPVPHVCPENSAHVGTCTEGTSLVPLIQKVRGLSGAHPHMQWKKAAFSQYLRNSGSHHPVMGYSVRTDAYRYTEWVVYDNVHHRANLSALVGRELYQHSTDPYEFHNLAEGTSHRSTIADLSSVLHAGWRKTQQDYLKTLN